LELFIRAVRKVFCVRARECNRKVIDQLWQIHIIPRGFQQPLTLFKRSTIFEPDYLRLLQPPTTNQ